MAGVSRINGFRPVKKMIGGGFAGQVNSYFVPSSDATPLFVGDFVKLAGDARSPSGVPTVTRAAATDAVCGVVVGISFEGIGDLMNIPNVSNLNTPIYRAASTNAYILVADDPNLVLEAQCTGTLATADIGLNVSPIVATGSLTAGTSAYLSTKATTATLPLKLVGFPNRPDNNIGDAFVSAYVTINNHQYKGGTGTAGV
jgi:hypothetical protein